MFFHVIVGITIIVLLWSILPKRVEFFGGVVEVNEFTGMESSRIRKTNKSLKHLCLCIKYT